MAEEKRLDIKTVNGYSYLFLQFNCNEGDKKKHKDAFDLLMSVMKTVIEEKNRKKGAENYNDEGFYETRLTDNITGYCISIKFGSVKNETAALDIVKNALNLAKEFINFESASSSEDELSLWIKKHALEATSIAEVFETDIFEKHCYSFKQEYWDPFD